MTFTLILERKQGDKRFTENLWDDEESPIYEYVAWDSLPSTYRIAMLAPLNPFAKSDDLVPVQDIEFRLVERIDERTGRYLQV